MESPYTDPSIHMFLIYAEGSKSNHYEEIDKLFNK